MKSLFLSLMFMFFMVGSLTAAGLPTLDSMPLVNDLPISDDMKSDLFKTAMDSVPEIGAINFLGDGVMQAWVTDAYTSLTSESQQALIKSLYETWNKIDGIDTQSVMNLMNGAGDVISAYPPSV